MHDNKKLKGLAKEFFVLDQTIKMVYRTILADAVRSLMTCLGIIIGTGSLIVMMSIMDIRTEKSRKDIEESGYDRIEIQLYPENFYNGLLQKDMDNLKAIEHVAGVTPVISGQDKSVAKSGDKIVKKVSFTGVSNEFYEIGKTTNVSIGSGLSGYDVENELPVCVINSRLAKALYGREQCVGQTFNLKGIEFKVKGVDTAKKSNTDSSGNIMHIPYTLMRKMTGGGVYDVIVYADDTQNIEALDKEVRKYLDDTLHSEGKEIYYDMFDPYSLSRSQRDIQTTATLQMVIAAIALIIGGIGIMNMMLVMVKERTVEIGLRKALGSSRGRIQAQFVIEAIVVSMTGGIIGVICGCLASVGYCVASGETIHVNIPSAFAGLIFSLAVGVFFGWSPAKMASQLQPIDALKGGE